MLSIVKAVNQLDKLEAMHRAALDSYSEVLRATAEYPVQVDAMEAHIYQQHIQALRQMLENVLRSEDFQTIHTSFRGELRDYRDKVNDWLDRTRGELKAAAEAMHTLSDRVAANGTATRRASRNPRKTHVRSANRRPGGHPRRHPPSRRQHRREL
ncbi:MAG TPA: hypothetical protein VEV85_25760 [Bryobacteraceae bacterium]|nr:hypothetical protein [Bryobacteraceae bacterium]